MKKTMIGTAGLALVALTVVATGCSSKNETNEASANASGNAKTNDAASANAAADVKKIIVGTGTQFPKVCFLDENGKLTGFDVELVKEIDKRLPGYEFEFQTLDFSNLLLSLETKKIDFVAHEMEQNPDRAAKYLFNKEAYAHWKTKIIVPKDKGAAYKNLDDLKGKKVLTTATSAEATLLETYNKSHDDAIKIVYTNGAANDTVSQLTSGRVDATLGADFTLSLIDPQAKLASVGDTLEEADVQFVFRKDDPDGQKLADAVDGAIKEIKADGTLGKLSVQWLGEDYTQE
ncbi:transporter substrate-binding domain-containing protein [Paenibacillus sacheonensis]|uniref:Transporter substrate-binding domain-containing protein n=1 Tax=Paenibacillus sacheonensis TaxID=742054 RepID=A0A7X4YSC6_9BACL|nr:transporter substrate-binding domain-containing protein [Paenibacillus sacheonensis]MBM7566747.1 L-cystine transport system substrate-binding protein [Paenibacillus sacheonensis]NBC71677.1 transporter substrate-binding domain-containing protein [Paenibacillus sacheonensis]